MMWLLLLGALLIVLAAAIYYDKRKKHEADVHYNPKEYEKRPHRQQAKEKYHEHYGIGGEGNQPPPT
ncbi:LPXTG cell wall anchor domain-containing protein [Alkalihalobacillus sp. AL-G]|uniref:LPXTG cell wall anchor domain-containing protein n=1 Tax=Alkalihalobacillus sp. AL-G TaxID=2926399 RepID=UPI00272AA624|nr:LPXTG cell wall anchor domain-containing protein [Alkalihalobacillus sp. AL-G]WLD94198.1 LPXTG cell wall anchor domain-containing protein [Alkalihalobacillus sp. AL-G]